MIIPTSRQALAGLAVAAFLVPPAPSLAVEKGAGHASAQDSVSLKFGWPKNLRGKVEYKIRRVRKGGGQTRSSQISGSYEMKAASVSDGIRISAHRGTVSVKGAQRPRSRAASMQSLMAELMKSPPSFVVDRAGEFRRLEGVSAFRGNMQDAIRRMTAELPDNARARLDRAIAPLISEAQLSASVANNWNRDVGAWLGAKLDHGDLYRSTYQAPMPALGNRSVPMVTTFKFIRRLPCRTGEKKQRCVELEMRSFVDDDGLKKVMQDYLAAVAGGSANIPVFKKLSNTTTVRLITEPGTLVPHQVHTRRVTTALVAMKGRDIPTEQIHETRTIYTY